MDVQIFGVKKNADTRKARRFFSERRVRTQFVDFKVRSPSLGELRRFAQKFGTQQLINREAKLFDDLGLRHAQLSDDQWLHKLAEEPLLLRMPLTRYENHVTIGLAEEEWCTWSAVAD
jgi:arsenate reductase-like glutaredoxin family protein